MSSNVDQSEAGPGQTEPSWKPDSLRERVEELAAKLVLGDTGGEQWAALLAGVRQQAETAGRADVARIAAESLAALSSVADAEGRETLFSASIARMQQALSADGADPIAHDVPAAPPALPPPPLSLGEDPEMIGDFIFESRDHLTQVEIQMMTLEKDPGDSEAINTVFRGFHTIKGLAGFLDLGDIREVAHETETLLDLARNQKLRITPPVVDIVLAAADFLKIWLKRLEAALAGSAAEPPPEKGALLERIRRGAAAEPAEDAATQVAAGPIVAEPIVAADGDPAERPSGGNRKTQGADTRAETRSVKVDTAKLDFLVDMAGEMVIAQSMVRHHPELAALRSPAVLRNLAQLARITGDLQKTAMSMRMVPVGGLFQKMSRLVRDLARKTGKQAEMDAIGGDTELDRNIVEELADPLMHMVPQRGRPWPGASRGTARGRQGSNRAHPPPRQPSGGAYRH